MAMILEGESIDLTLKPRRARFDVGERATWVRPGDVMRDLRARERRARRPRIAGHLAALAVGLVIGASVSDERVFMLFRLLARLLH